jgi:hypothetical protein
MSGKNRPGLIEIFRDDKKEHGNENDCKNQFNINIERPEGYLEIL